MCTAWVGFPSGSAFKIVGNLHVSTGLTLSSAVACGLLPSVMIYSTRSHRSEFINPVPLSYSSGLTIICLNFLNDHDGEVLHTICRKVKVCRDWFLCPLASQMSNLRLLRYLCREFFVLPM